MSLGFILDHAIPRIPVSTPTLPQIALVVLHLQLQLLVFLGAEKQDRGKGKADGKGPCPLSSDIHLIISDHLYVV